MSRLTRFLRKPLNFGIVAATSAGIVFSIKTAPHLFPNYLYRPVFEAYRTGNYCKLTEEQNREFLEVCDDLGIDPAKYNAFVTSRWEAKSVGLPWFPSGCHIGVPATLVSEPDLSNIRFSGPIKANLDSREGLWLRDSLKMGKEARKFAIGQQIALSDSNLPFYSIVLAPVATVAGFATTFIVQILSPLVPIYVTGLAVGTCFYFACSFCMAGLNERVDLRVNQRLANLSDAYVMGGLEFYEKLLQRNRGLRKLLGSRGEQLYTYYGNETPGLVYSSGATNIQKRDILKELFDQKQKERSATENRKATES
ncbi:transmembrane protein 177-like [Diadema setosum]|uniref:transmembrane protein 177-like n=1 Tax=Diadema setosum TaxID=31175 RepID=UPI003B3BE00C